MIAISKKDLQRILADPQITDEATVWLHDDGVYQVVTLYEKANEQD